jgi:UDP-N-acetylmuramoyl-tripeptide--D-alanyl-D-alanine ligase
MITGSINTIAAIVAGTLNPVASNGTSNFTGISTDTRSLKAGNLFIALKGKNYDGHNFVAAAAQQGAAAVVVSSASAITAAKITTILVTDTLTAFGKIAQYWRQKFQLPIIGITGSNGKTTIKNMITAILMEHCHNKAGQVLATTGNFNNCIGVPQLLVQLNDQHRYAVVEMGMNNFGEIGYLSSLVQPQIAVISNAGPAHLERLHDISGVAKAKGEIFSQLPSPPISAILNADDPYYNYWCHLAGAATIYSFGWQRQASVRAISAITNANNTQELHIASPAGNITLVLPLIGQHNALNALAAIAASLSLGLPVATIQAALSGFTNTTGRLTLTQFKHGINLIDDSYNANPASVTAAINTLASFPGTKILVLGDMKELGANNHHWHQTIGKTSKAAGLTYLFTYGRAAAAASDSFGDNAYHFDDQSDYSTNIPGQEALVSSLTAYLQANTTILIKGSRVMHMDKIVQRLQQILAKH